MFKVFAFFALLATALCAPSPVPKPGLALTYNTPDISFYRTYSAPLAYSNSYAYSNLGYAYAPGYYSNSYYNAPLAYGI